MKLQLVPIGELDRRLLEELRASLATMFRGECELLSNSVSPEFAYHPERQQYHSSEILAHMQNGLSDDCWRVLGVTAVDLYIPILTFVFGEAQMGGRCALVSLHRLRQEFYGMPPDQQLLRDRLVKEAVHELGHTLELTHCDDYTCVMAASHAVEWIDIKEPRLCSVCYNKILAMSE
ncbi:MAG: archaemetzincin family Zn-dependent metalloprotease [Terriglobales bacterium]